MLQSIIFSLPLLVASAVASPTWGPWKGKGQAACLSDSTVNTIIDSYTYLLENPQGADFNTTAGALLSDSFFVSSDSINTLINANGGKLPVRPCSCPLGPLIVHRTNSSVARCKCLPKQASFHCWSGTNSRNPIGSDAWILL